MHFKSVRMVAPLVFALFVAGVGLTGCEPASKPPTLTVSMSVRDPGKYLLHDWSPGIPIEEGVVNSCFRAQNTEIVGYHYVCRVVDGDDAHGDNRNWRLNVGNGGHFANGGILTINGQETSRYGLDMMTYDGYVYEGCVPEIPGSLTQYFDCDYRSRKYKVVDVDGGATAYFLQKLWNWYVYAGNAAGCAMGIGALLAGAGQITWGLMAGCVGQPM